MGRRFIKVWGEVSEPCGVGARVGVGWPATWLKGLNEIQRMLTEAGTFCTGIASPSPLVLRVRCGCSVRQLAASLPETATSISSPFCADLDHARRWAASRS